MNRKIINVMQVGFVLLLIAIVVIGVTHKSKPANVKASKTIVAAASPARESQTPDVSDSQKWSKVFSDNFLGTSLDRSKWTTCYDWYDSANMGCTNGGNNEQEWYLDQQVAVAGSMATLSAENTPVTIHTSGKDKTYPYRSGMISTGRPNANSNVKWSGEYGYYEAKMKVDGGQGVWPAFWLLPIDRKWPPEIDIMELLGSKPNQVLLSNHWAGQNSVHQYDTKIITGTDYTQGWHIYAVNWQPKRIDWYIDGQLEKTITGDTVPNEPMELIINLAVGGRLPGYIDNTTPSHRQVQVDYVNVYKLK